MDSAHFLKTNSFSGAISARAKSQIASKTWCQESGCLMARESFLNVLTIVCIALQRSVHSKVLVIAMHLDWLREGV